MRHKNKIVVLLLLAGGLFITQCSKENHNHGVNADDPALVREGKQIFRFDDLAMVIFGVDCYIWIGPSREQKMADMARVSVLRRLCPWV